MPPTFKLEVVTPERRVFSGQVEAIVVPGSEGYLGVLARHAPLLAGLGVGEAKVTAAGGETWYLAIAGGFLEVGRERTVILADAAERAEEIDVARARAAEGRAQQRLRAHAAGTDVDRAQAALRRALNRLRVAQYLRR